MRKCGRKKYLMYPSRMSCLYESKTFEDTESWGNFFAELGRPTYSSVKPEINGNYFIGDAAKCFDGTTNKEENLRLAELYWENRESNERAIEEMLVDGTITVVEVILNRQLKCRFNKRFKGRFARQSAATAKHGQYYSCDY